MWHDLKETNRYQINKSGQIRNIKTKRLLKQHPDKNSYLRVILWNGEKRLNRIVHRLLAIQFIPNPNNKPHVNHIDGNKQNNNIDNLEWVTNQENMDHAWKNNLMNPRPGIKHHNCKLTETDIFNIINDRKNGLSQKATAKKYKVHKNHISRITSGTRWNTLTGVK